LIDLEEKLSLYMERILKDKKHEFAMLAGRLDSVSPLKKLESGYAYVSDMDDKMVDSAKNVSAGDLLQITLADGRLVTKVEKVQEKDYGIRRNHG
jgi:exodeoxyribonuclease VII large subunit